MRSEELPVVAGEVIGWRAWRLFFDGLDRPILRSIWHDDDWPTDDWMRAKCVAAHEIPDPNHPCGIYVAREPGLLVKLRYHEQNYGGSGGVRVLGQVGLAGKVIPGERTYRAARARVVRVWVPFDQWELARPIADAYRVPVRLGNITKFEEVAAR